MFQLRVAYLRHVGESGQLISPKLYVEFPFLKYAASNLIHHLKVLDFGSVHENLFNLLDSLFTWGSLGWKYGFISEVLQSVRKAHQTSVKW